MAAQSLIIDIEQEILDRQPVARGDAEAGGSSSAVTS
jgi:hypothetical protein